MSLFHAGNPKLYPHQMWALDAARGRDRGAIRASAGRGHGKAHLASLMARAEIQRAQAKFIVWGWMYGFNKRDFTELAYKQTLRNAIGCAKGNQGKHHDIVFVEEVKTGRCWQIRPTIEEIQYAKDTGYL